jgi:CheY-like chemotaxis protein/anti-sigma regulatory factor (Ser/Thr protein kinase)
VLGEPAALTNAIMNLCVNAVDAMPAGGVLCLQTRTTPAGEVEAIVTDTGLGMAPEVLARAMEPFFTTKPPGKGTGLGLPGVYGTMKAHGGSVQLTSEEGRGTRVVLRFPRYAPEEATPHLLAAPAPAGPAEALFILVVDDDPVIQETLPSLLGFLGHRCRLAVGGQEALDLLAGGLQVDLVILDHNMPGLSGADTLVRIREALPQLPVLLSTGFLEPGVEDLTHRFSGVALLYKPYSLAGIRRKLEGMQLRSGTRREKAQLIS